MGLDVGGTSEVLSGSSACVANLPIGAGKRCGADRLDFEFGYASINSGIAFDVAPLFGVPQH
jgi:hypothetical protein